MSLGFWMSQPISHDRFHPCRSGLLGHQVGQGPTSNSSTCAAQQALHLAWGRQTPQVIGKIWVGQALPVGLLKPAIPQTKAISFPPHTNTFCKQVALSPDSTSSSHMERCLPHQASACSTLNHFSRPLLLCSTPWSSSPPPLLIVLMPPCKPTTFDIKITTTTGPPPPPPSST